MKRYGFVASGGGYRSFYTCGALVWLAQQGIPVTHITSTSSGNNIVLDYLMWDRKAEDLPPTLTRTMRLSVGDIAHVFANFLGLRPAFLPNGSYLFTVDRDSCRKSLLLDDAERRSQLAASLKSTSWTIATTNLTKRRSETFAVNDILAGIDDGTLERFMDVFLAGITTVPYFKAITIGDDYYLEGGYTDNTPLRPIFEDPDVDEIIAVDFTDYDYHRELERIYEKNLLTLPMNSIDMYLLVADIGLTLPNAGKLEEARRINALLGAAGQQSLSVGGKTYYAKPIHVLRPSNLESMTVSLKHAKIQKEYFELGGKEMATLADSMDLAKAEAQKPRRASRSKRTPKAAHQPS